MKVLVVGGPYPLALRDSPEDYIGLKGALSFSLARQPELANITLTT